MIRCVSSIFNRPYWYTTVRNIFLQHQRELQNYLQQAIAQVPCGTCVLDLCSGPGEFAHILGDHHGYCGTDINVSYLEQAVTRCSSEKNCSYVCSHAASLPFKNNAFDTTFFINSSHHFADDILRGILGEGKRVTKRRFVYIDAVKDSAVKLIGKLLMRFDRGSYFRNVEEIEAVVVPIFGSSEKTFFWNGPYRTVCLQLNCI